MSRIIDQTNDPGFSHLRVVVERYPQLREMCKTANLSEAEYSELPDQAFAWPGQRKFPVHTREHVGLSVGYSKLAASLPSDVTAMLEKAAALHSIEESVFQPPEVEKVGSTGEYLLPEKQRLCVRCAEDLPRVERVYHEKYAQLSLEDRATAGFNLVKLAEQHGVALSPSTQKLAGFTITSTREFRDWIGARKEAAVKLGSSISEAYRAIEDKYKGVSEPITDRGDQLKLAQLLHGLDKQSGVSQYYGKKIPTPIETVFNTTKLAKDFVKVGSALQNKALLQTLPLTFWQDTLGEDVAAEIAPDGQVDLAVLEQIIPTLPADLKVALETQLAAYNK